MDAVTLPPAGSGHTFLCGCFFRSQGRRGQRKEKEPSVTFPFSQGGAVGSHKTPRPRGAPGTPGPRH